MMASSINTNLASLTAQRSSSRTQNDLATAIARLSSGLRINSARDDAAGLAISDRFTAQIRGINQAARNANDGISLAQTAEGSLASVSANLQRMRELAVQSANATNSSSDRASLQLEVSQLGAEIDRVAKQTQFNGSNLLDGSFTSKTFQVGANVGQTIGVSIGSAKAADLGNNRVTGSTGIFSPSYPVTGGPSTPANYVKAQNIAIDSGGVSASVAVTAGQSAATVAAAINTAADKLGVTATAHTQAYFGGYGYASGPGFENYPGSITFDLKGRNSTAVTIAATVTATDMSGLIAAVNAKTAITGISAEYYAGTNLADSIGIRLSNTDGSDIVIGHYLNLDMPGAGEAYVASGSDPSQFDGIGGPGPAIAVFAGSIDLAASTSFNVTTTGGPGYGRFFSETGLATSTMSSALSPLSAVDIGSAAGAADALSVIDSALQSIDKSRAAMGAVENRFASTVGSLQSTGANLAASRSRIEDADFAMETANLSRAQVLQQAGTAMVAQANQLPQQVMQLLR